MIASKEADRARKPHIIPRRGSVLIKTLKGTHVYYMPPEWSAYRCLRAVLG